MFGKMPRGATARPKKIHTVKTVPTWLWVITLMLSAICFVILLTLWRPWQPVSTARSGMTDPTPGDINQRETNQDYKFYNLLPNQKVTPIPDQALPQAQTPIVVVEQPSIDDTSSSDQVNDPFNSTSDNVQDRAATLDDNQSTATKSNAMYILQVKSFEDANDADSKRGEVVLNGVPAEVVIANEGSKIWYRVIAGPFTSQDAARNAQQALQNVGIDTLIVKRKS